MLTTPLAYIIFNRPEHTQKTFSQLRAQQPTKLFIIADGPRPDHPTDVERCLEVRKIVEHIDWPCEVHRNYANLNLGLKHRVSSGLDWVFGKVERAIILEDDCLPNSDFFVFCEVLLERYASDQRIWVVTGNNFQNGRKHDKASYYFSKYNHCWGWATWHRAWQHYRGDLPFWPEWKNSIDWRQKVPDPKERHYWEQIFERVKRNESNSWAYPWTACVWYHGGLTATPNVNLVTNIGIGPEATHTVACDNLPGLPVHDLAILTHPKNIVQCERADKYTFDHHFVGKHKRLINRIFRVLRSYTQHKF